MSTNQHPRNAGTVFTIVLVVTLFACGCSTSNNALVESTPAYQPPPVAPQIKLPNFAPAKLTEVQAAVRRVFKEAVVMDSSSSPNFFTGDFNGDASQDLAVILKPAPGRLAELNEEYPAWLLRDPIVGREGRDGRVKPTLSIEERDVLLAIIHGYGDNEWRDSQATQTFLLKNAVGSNLTVKTAHDFLNAHSGRKLPRPQGDLIGETLQGTNGYLYYSSANYLWYDPKTFKPTSSVGMVHPAH